MSLSDCYKYAETIWVIEWCLGGKGAAVRCDGQCSLNAH
jgi:hypothetical protein